MFQTSRISVSPPPELWPLVSIRLSLGALAASFERYILASFIRCRRHSQRVKQICSRSTVIRYTHLYICIRGVLFYRSVLPPREHIRVAPWGSAGHIRFFFLVFFHSAVSTTLVKPRNTRYRVVLAYPRPREAANVTFTMSDYRTLSQIQTRRTNKEISASRRNANKAEERQRSE